MRKTTSLILSEQPQATMPQFEPHLHTWFLLDRVRGEKTLTSFYQGNTPIEKIDYLLLGTEHENLIDVSPLLIKLSHTNLPSSVYKHIETERSGIFFQAEDSNILEHLQYLFIMNSEQQGKIYARYYDPFFWISLQLSQASQSHLIWGNITKAYSPMLNSNGQFCYFCWSTPMKDKNTVINKTKPIFLTKEFYEISDQVKLLNLLYKISYEENISVSDECIPTTLTNLQQLTKAEITRPDLLKKLIPFCIKQNDFSVQPEVQAVLLTEHAPYEKVEQLELIFKGR